MRHFFLTIICVVSTVVAMAQGGRTVKGVVLDDRHMPIAGATITAVNSDVSTQSNNDGSFSFVAPTFAREVEVTIEGFITQRLEIDGSYLMFKLKIDKNYYAAKAKAEEDARIAAEKKAEAERIAAEKAAAAKAKAEEDARIAAEKKAEAERIAAEKAAAAKIKAEEDARIAAEKKAEAERIAAEKAAAAKIKAEEDARIAAEKKAEAERIAAEKAAAAKIKAEEDARIAAEKKAEAERIAAEKAAAAKIKAEEDARIAAEKKAEAGRIAKERADKREALKIEYAKHIKGYESFAGVSYSMMSNESYAGVNYIGGYRINNNFFLGAGVGANVRVVAPVNNVVIYEALTLSHGNFYIPAFIHFRAQLLNRRCTPFLALSAGYNISSPQQFDLELTSIKYNASGMFVNPQVGVTYRVKPKLGIYCAVGFDASMMPECIDNTGYSATIQQGFKYGINVNLGISF